jgi:hypothetical protein
MVSVRERYVHGVRAALLHAGFRIGHKLERRLLTIHNHLDTGAWVRTVADGMPTHFHRREELFETALPRVTGSRPLYLEFGVWQGESLRWWSKHLTAPAARFVGFDSFEGLPERWNQFVGAGAFALDNVPQFDDERISLQVGWFSETLPTFEVPEHDQLIVNIDSDLYSSAVEVLSRLEDYLVPGTLIYFDEFADRDHELRAFREFLVRTGKDVEPLGYAAGQHWLFVIK